VLPAPVAADAPADDPATEVPVTVETPSSAVPPAPIPPVANRPPALPAATTTVARREPVARDASADTRTARPVPSSRPIASAVPPPPERETPREVAAVEAPAAPRGEPVRRVPEPPAPATAPREEALELVRGYVAARNTSHASGIRRVWPGVDDVHIRRVTSAFSAPLTLSACDVDATDAARAIATCQLTQPGTTGAYASGQPLTIRRTFVFDLARQGRNWVIVGLRE
jgi:hypothetical protein